MNYEERVEFLGSWGPFQRRLFTGICVSALPSGFAVLSVIFLLATPPHHCFIPPSANLSPDWATAVLRLPVRPAPEKSIFKISNKSLCLTWHDLMMNL